MLLAEVLGVGEVGT